MAMLQSLSRWLGWSKGNPRPGAEQRPFRLTLEGMEDRLLLSAAPVLSGEWFVQSDGGAASIVQNGTQLTLTNEQGTQTIGQLLTPTSFQAWGQTAQVVQNGDLTEILWNGNTWTQSAWQNGGLAGQWFVETDSGTASIAQTGNQLVLTNEYGSQTVGQWVSPTSFQAWGVTAQVVQKGALTEVLWNGNAWTQSTWQNGGLAGQWYVKSNGLIASIVQNGTQLTLTNEQGTQTTGQWLSPTSFQAWGETAQVVQDGNTTEILWNGNTWTQSTWQNGGLAGQWFEADGGAASITQSGNQLTLTDEKGVQTTGQWVSLTSFQAGGQTGQVVQNGAITEIDWNGEVWSQSTWQQGGLAGKWFVQSNGGAATIDQTGGQLTLVNEKGTETAGQWLSPTSFQAWGQTAQVVQNASGTQITWNGNTWTQSAWQNGGLSGAWVVQSDGGAASIAQIGNQLVLTNEQGTQTVAQWVSPTSFQAWGQTAQIIQNGASTEIVWNGNAWTQSGWQGGDGLTGEWLVQSDGLPATIVQVANQLLLTNEQGTQSVGQWVSPTTFQAWGQTAQIIQNGAVTQIKWNGNTWSKGAA